MKKILSLAVAGILLFSSVAIAQTATKTAAKAVKKFDGNDWLALSKRARANAVTSYIAAAKQQGITIKKTPVFYAKRLDTYYINEKVRTEPVEKVLKTLMIMEYDWSQPGQSKEELAKTWLGDDIYKKNKERLSRAVSFTGSISSTF